MTATEILKATTAVGGELCRIGDKLSIRTIEPLAPELVGYLREFKDDLLTLLPLGPQDARQALPDGHPSHTPAADNERTHAPYIARCAQCGSAQWGPTGASLTETLRNGEQVQTEIWHCLNCASLPEGTRPPVVPEPIPPGSVSNSSRRHTLGETPPPFDCPGCGHRDWREAIYHWACRHCQHMEMKSNPLAQGLDHLEKN